MGRGLEKPKRPPKSSNPLQIGIRNFLATQSPEFVSAHGFSSTSDGQDALLPKRFTVYPPLLLLPVNAFTAPPTWAAFFKSLTEDQRQRLYECIAAAFRSQGVTHIAVNAPIELTGPEGKENCMRSPTGLTPLFGDFGPSPSSSSSEAPRKEDYDRALWARAAQNGGIVQTWAPLYTMFSRGNVTEKARILGLESRFDGLDDENLSDFSVVDMYAGIGYFVFSYLKRGVGRVWGFEINPWSVEGLRRGCVENGWPCQIVRLQDDGSIDADGGLERLVDKILQDESRVVVFHGDNRFAAGVLASIRPLLEAKNAWLPIRHVNLGLLPTSESSWDPAYALIDRRFVDWVHVHENVDVKAIEAKRDYVLQRFKELAWKRGERPEVACHHVEQVKTYAPGVMHCVFDITVGFPRETDPKPDSER